MYLPVLEAIKRVKPVQKKHIKCGCEKIALLVDGTEAVSSQAIAEDIISL